MILRHTILINIWKDTGHITYLKTKSLAQNQLVQKFNEWESSVLRFVLTLWNCVIASGVFSLIKGSIIYWCRFLYFQELSHSSVLLVGWCSSEFIN